MAHALVHGRRGFGTSLIDRGEWMAGVHLGVHSYSFGGNQEPPRSGDELDLATVLNTMGVGVFVCDQTGTMLVSNNAALKIRREHGR